MKKGLFIVGIGALVAGCYYYFKRQVDLALNYDYDISDVKILTLTDERADVKVDVKLSNKSSFEIEILDYNIDLFYKGVLVGNAQSGDPFKIYAESSVTITATGSVVFKDAFKALGPFVTNVLQRKPIDLDVSGHVKVKFLGIPHTISFDKEKFNYSADLLKELGLAGKYEKLQQRFPFLRKI